MKKIIALVVLAALLVGGYVGLNQYLTRAQRPVSTENTDIIKVEIAEGSNTSQIASKLSEKKLIRDERVFKYVAKKEGMDSKFKAGNYSLSQSMDMREITENLTNGAVEHGDYSFTVPEGYEIRQIADLLSEDGVVDREKFIKLASDTDRYRQEYDFLDAVPEDKGLEGYLYPDTYMIDKSSDNIEEFIIKMMLKNFDRYYTEEHVKRAEELGLNTNEVITLASIVEREARVESERPLVSAVFHNRINDGMSLQSCATVQYILEERKPVLSYEDTKIESPYNTYKYAGLPPAPIASPGVASIEAALNPDDVDYMYFVAKEDGSGSHVFSKTYQEHIDAQNNNQN
jgi:UPF0755 protein